MEDGLEELQQRLVEMLLAFQEFTQDIFSGRRKCIRRSQTSGLYSMG